MNNAKIKTIKLTEVCDFQGGSQPPKEEWINKKQDGYIRMLQIREFTQDRTGKEEYVKLTKSIKTCREDDILIARYGASLGKILTGMSGAYNVAIMKTIPNEEVLNKKYLFYYLSSPIFQHHILNLSSRAAQAGFNKNDLKDLLIPLPSLGVQMQITEILNKVVELINLRRQRLADLDNLIKSVFYDMFGDPVTNPMGWTVKPLSQVVSKIGSGATPKGGRETYIDDGISLIRSMNVYNGYFKYDELAHITDEQAKQLDNVTIQANDILLNITGASVARSCIVPNEVIPARVNQHVSIIRCESFHLNYIFANAILISDSYQRFLLSIGESGGATRQAITKQQIENLSIILPPINIQTRFADFVLSANKIKLDMKKSIKESQLLFDSLMNRYFD